MAVVWYVGPADVRTIDSTEWTRIALPGATKTWDKTNGWSINQSAFSAGQLTLLGGLNEFTLNAAADGTPRPGSVVTAAPDSALTLGDMVELIAEMAPMARTNNLVSMFSRCNIAGSSLSSGTPTSGTAAIEHVALADGHGIVVAFSNIYSNNGVDTPGPQDITIRASVQIGSTLYPVFFRGNRQIVLSPGGIVYGDEIAIDYSVGDVIRSRTYSSVAVAATKYPIGHARAYTPDSVYTSEFNNAGAPGADITDATSSGSFGGSVFSPALILGRPAVARRVVLGVVGDSIAFGNGDANSDFGFTWRFATASGAQTSLARVCLPSNQLTLEVSSGGYKQRWRPLEGCTDVINQLGVNDYRAGRTLAQMQADTLTLGLRLSRRGARVWRTTVTPSVTTTDNYITLGNQTTHANESVRLTFNAWVRDGCPMSGGAAVATGTSGAARCAVYDSNGALVTAASGATHYYAGVIELADAVESARNSGKWDVAPIRTVADAAITSGAATLTSSTAAFTSADLGAGVLIAGAGAASADLLTNIIKVTSATSVVVATNASTTVSGASLKVGVPTTDGLHPAGHMHQRSANAIPRAAMLSAV
jgi:lysophospholipase L1-like esterase